MIRSNSGGSQDLMDLGLTRRALITALLLTVLAGFWVRQSEIEVLATQITESVPAIPGITALMLLLGANGLMRLLRIGKPFHRSEILVIFLFVTVSSMVMGIGVTQFLICLIATPFYYKTNNIQLVRKYLPNWLVPHNLQIIKGIYEGSANGQVPWSQWGAPIFLWICFFLALWWTISSLLSLLYSAWSEDERLSFPLASLALEMTGEANEIPFFRNKIMWVGFGVAALYDSVNILHALVPSVPAFGKRIDFGVGFTALPWSEMKPFIFHIRPELIGLGFLVSTEISLTVWVSYLLFKLTAVWGAAHGVPPGQLPYSGSQGIGAYLMMALVMFWLARRNIQSAWQKAVHGGNWVGLGGMKPRWMFGGIACGFFFCWFFMWAAGMGWWVALIYLLLVIAVAAVYARLRAEAGVPLIWLFPFEMQKDVMLNVFGSAPFQAAGKSDLSVWALFVFLARGYYPEVTAYQSEGLEIAKKSEIRPQKIVQALFLAVLAGLLLGWYNHLVPYYNYGALQLRGGIWGDWISTTQYSSAAAWMHTPKMPDVSRSLAAASGAALVFALWLLRLWFAGFWFHPIGYCMACSYGSLIWGSFLVVWIMKSLTLRYGGMKLYKTLRPFFLGLVLGHFVTAGIAWGLMGVWVGSAVQGYQVYFG